MIVAAAIKFPGREGHALICHVPRPGRHHHVLHSLRLQFSAKSERTAKSFEGEVQGFLTDKGEFLDRRTALVYALGHGQVKPRQAGDYTGDELFSEDLW